VDELSDHSCLSYSCISDEEELNFRRPLLGLQLTILHFQWLVYGSVGWLSKSDAHPK
jgi:hypothetical protein